MPTLFAIAANLGLPELNLFWPNLVWMNGKIYAIGGISQAGWEAALSTVEAYDPKPPSRFFEPQAV